MRHKGAKKPQLDASSALLAAEHESGEEEEAFEVDQIINDRDGDDGKEYLVKWVGYDAKHNTWEPEGNLTGCDVHLASYNTRKGQRTKSEKSPTETATSSSASGAAKKKSAPIGTNKRPASRAKGAVNAVRLVPKRGVQPQPDDRSSSSKSDSVQSPVPVKRPAAARTYTASAAAVLAMHDSDGDSEDLPLGEPETKKSRSASKMSRSASKNSIPPNTKQTRSMSKSSLPSRASRSTKASGSEEIVMSPARKLDSRPDPWADAKSASRKKQEAVPSDDEEEIVASPPKKPTVRRGVTAAAVQPSYSAPDDEDEEEEIMASPAKPRQAQPVRSGRSDNSKESGHGDEETVKRILRERLETKKAESKPVASKPAAAKKAKGRNRQGKNKKKIAQASTYQAVESDEEEEEDDEKANASEAEYEVEEVIGAVRAGNGHIWGLVKWKGYDLGDCTWEDVSNMQNAEWAVQEFYNKHGKPSKKMPRVMTEEGKSFEKKHERKSKIRPG